MSSAKRENIWVNLLLNVILPSLLLAKGGQWSGLDPAPVLMLALSFPLAYGIYDALARKKTNLFSIIGFVSVLITGAVGLIENVDTRWIAVKEAAIPLLFGIAILISGRTKKPLVRSLMFSPELFDVPRIEGLLKEKGNENAFEKVLASCQHWLVGSFLLSAILNYVLADWLVKSPSGTEAFNEEVGKMTALSWPVIAVPTTLVMMFGLIKLVKGIEQSTGEQLDQLLHPELREKQAQKDAAAAQKLSQDTPNEERNP